MATVTVPPTIPQPTQDCQQLRNAFSLGRGGTDERKVIEILAHRKGENRKDICHTYVMLYKEDLKQRMRLELTKDLERSIVWWMTDPVELDAQLAREALRSWSTDYRVIIETACCQSTEELLNVRKEYQALYNQSLEEDIAWETNGGTQKLLVALATAYRYTGPVVNMTVAKLEAEQLYGGGEGKTDGIDEDLFVRILGTRSFGHLNAVFDHYKELYGHDINKGLKEKHAGEMGAVIRTTIKCINRPARYFAKVLNLCLKGLQEGRRSEEKSLTRIVVTRAEIDMQRIKAEFIGKYGRPLENAIKDATVGNHRSFLLHLIGSEDDI
ncbi:hypothetical protein SUGI_0322330 [Cryptomeria japonica]|uniref:annexin Gh1 n=1 Tax=Cryptomeria japonica TaxID=3369 RepID=UPI002408DE11|nr:annexin Gh1 [Cryptomeria japonica]GLJ18221.1 hypothetical protein SUGI_0322330 [Cryptomeria japonica]